MYSIEKAMEQSTIGFAKHQLIYDERGNPKDYIFLSLNPAFENITGLKREALLNRQVTEVMPKVTQGYFDWIGFFGNIVSEGKKEVFEYYATPLDKWYRVEAFSCEKDCFTTLFTDITNERELVHASKTFLNDEQKANTYEEITQRMKHMTGADYVALNIFLEDGESFQTVAITGIPGVLQKVSQKLGFNPQNKEWAPDPHRMALIRDQSVTTFDHLHELTNHVLPKTAIQLLEKTFNLGKTFVIKSTCGEKIIGDFTLMFSKEKELQNENEAIIYSDMVGMLIEKRKGLQKLTEKEGQLRESQQQYQSIAEDTPALICRSLPDTTIVYANQAYCDFFQRKLETLIGKPFMDLIRPDQHESVRAILSQLTPESPSITHEHPVFSPNDSGISWQRWTIRGLFDEAGKIISYQSIGMDITEERKAKNNLQMILDNMLDLVSVTDMTGKYRFVGASHKILGYEIEDLIGRNVMDFVHPEDLPHVQLEFDNFIQQKTKNPKVTYRYRCLDGSYLWFETLGTIIMDQKGEPKEILFNTRDITKQKQYEEQLSLFKTISDKALYGLAMSDSEGMLTYINPYFAKVHGYTPEELQGKHMSILHLKKHLPVVKKTFDEMNETGLFRPQEIWHAKKDGSEFPMLMSGVRFEKRVSVPEFYATSAIDISQQKKQQEELSRQYEEMEAMNEELANLNYKMELSNKRIKASEEKLSSLFQSMTEHVVLHELVFDKHGTPVNYRILECNRRFTEVTGITPEQAVGKLATQVYGTTTPPYLDIYASIAMNGTPHHFETFFPPMNKHFSVSAVSMGKNRFATITSDITEQKQRQFETERLKEQYELAVAGTNDGIWDWNILNNELFLSKRWKEMLGYEDWEIKNKFNSFISLIHEEDVPRVNDYVQRYLKGETEQYSMEFRMKHKNGSLVWILAKGEALRDENGKPYRMAGSHSDITERKEMEEQLIHAKEEAVAGNKAKSTFLANMNHELRTPLNGIIGFSDILRTMPLDEEQKGYVDIVYTSGKHLADIISDILDFSRIEAGKFELNTEKTEVKPLIENTLSMVRPNAEGKGLCLSSSIEHQVPETVEVDGARLRQVLLNLIANAVKFTDKGTVSVSVKLLERQPDQARLLFKVTDTGMGVKEEEQKKIFEPFHQAEMSVDKKSQGTGLGLSISKKMLELMGTSLELESEYGKGSTFSFELVLPFENEHSVDSNKTSKENTQDLKELANKKVLIAEDNLVNMQYAQTAIAMLSKDIHVIPAKDGEEAYQKYLKHRPDLILMDIRMPKLDGYQATTMIRAHDENIPIVAMTAKALEEDKEKCLASGMNEYLTKPVSLGQLKELLYQYL